MDQDIADVLSGKRRWAVVCADCLDVLPTLPTTLAVISDPPYGIRYNPSGGDRDAKRGNLPRIIGDDTAFDPSSLLGFQTVVLWGANHYADRLPAMARWLVWDKREGTASNDMADCELAWMNSPSPARLFSLRWMGMMRASERGQLRIHPNQKPVALMSWCLDVAKVPADAVVLDPYCGSGSTGVACLQTGRKFIGLEIDPNYCEIARRRLDNTMPLFASLEMQPEQAELFESP